MEAYVDLELGRVNIEHLCSLSYAMKMQRAFVNASDAY